MQRMRAALEAIAKNGLGTNQCRELALETLDKLDAPAAIKHGHYEMRTGEDGEYMLMHAGRQVGTINYYADALRVMDGLSKSASKIGQDQDNGVGDVMSQVHEYGVAVGSGDSEAASKVYHTIMRTLFVRPWMSPEPIAWFCVNHVTGKMQYTDSREASSEMRDQQHGHWKISPLFAGPEEQPKVD